ncbi:hypothetical protein MFRU_008g03260 [Monilinia fructicola]|nr:hypothetical protein MFRU_008g03260 [Monilinia fructicola]
MPPTNETTTFSNTVYRAVQEIPYGKVTTYGHIARLIGTPQRPRQVGTCLKHLPPTSPSPSPSASPSSSPSPHPNPTTHLTPWHRVINAQGTISPRTPHPHGAQTQATRLRREGVVVTTGSRGELCVDLAVYGWFPRQLPSEEAEGLDVLSEEE